MFHTLQRRILLSLIILGLIGAAIAFIAPLSQPQADNAPGSLKLHAPPFVSSAYAQDADLASFLEDEAGIAAYFKAPTAINLNTVRSFYRTIEAETPDYLIGSVPVDGYQSEEEDVHVYIHKEGWVLGYYLKADATAKVIDWGKYDGGVLITKFDTVLGAIAATLGVASPAYTYYHFQYPNATDLALIAEFVETNRVGSFQVNLPSAFIYFERSWSIGCKDYSDSKYFLNNKVAHDQYCPDNTNSSVSGAIPPVDLVADTFHTVRLEGANANVSGGLALVYRR
ncbi:MAG: hypothetical protein DCC55_32865 [Chloroflexi bacterium]|nr:MAG: hypothetical protein DCC55_32865 [Chloroflexota bacterium]